MHEIDQDKNQRYCGLLRRLLAMTYDGFIVMALLLLAGLIALPFSGPDVRAGRDPIFTSYLLLVWFTYFGWCWRQSGATLGMRAWRIQLVTGGGSVPSWSNCAMRFGVAFISALVAGLGFAWALWDQRRRCWHDIATGGYLVVRNTSNRPP